MKGRWADLKFYHFLLLLVAAAFLSLILIILLDDFQAGRSIPAYSMEALNEEVSVMDSAGKEVYRGGLPVYYSADRFMSTASLSLTLPDFSTTQILLIPSWNAGISVSVEGRQVYQSEYEGLPLLPYPLAFPVKLYPEDSGRQMRIDFFRKADSRSRWNFRTMYIGHSYNLDALEYRIYIFLGLLSLCGVFSSIIIFIFSFARSRSREDQEHIYSSSFYLFVSSLTVLLLSPLSYVLIRELQTISMFTLLPMSLFPLALTLLMRHERLDEKKFLNTPLLMAFSMVPSISLLLSSYLSTIGIDVVWISSFISLYNAIFSMILALVLMVRNWYFRKRELYASIGPSLSLALGNAIILACYSFGIFSLSWYMLIFASIMSTNTYYVSRILSANFSNSMSLIKVETLKNRSYMDNLTGLGNIRAMDRYVAQLVEYHEVERLAVIFFDIKGMKNTNDHYGHAQGDRLLLCFSRLLEKTGGHCFRIGGDEFLCFLHDVDSNRVGMILDNLRLDFRRNSNGLGDFYSSYEILNPDNIGDIDLAIFRVGHKDKGDR